MERAVWRLPLAAMGGKLRLIAEFPNRQPVAITLADITGYKPPGRGRGTKKRMPAGIRRPAARRKKNVAP